MMDKIAKAIAAALFAALAMLEVVNNDNVITGNEWTRVLVSLVGAGLTTWLIPNASLVTPEMIAAYLREHPETVEAYLHDQGEPPPPVGTHRWPAVE